MLHLLKRLRLTYNLYNFFHKKELKHNLPLYKKYGIRKSYYSSISSKDFRHLDERTVITPAEVLARLHHSTTFQSLPAESKASLEKFPEEGYAILRSFFSTQQVDEVNRTIETLLSEGKVKFQNRNKIMFAFKLSEAISSLGNDKKLLEILSILLGTEAILFQSINFLEGSEQHTHSDSIHMTTFPQGRLIAIWVALEDITADNGPLHFYPKSHLLPYYMNSDYRNEGNRWLIGSQSYDEYEKMIEEKIRESGLKKSVFLARKGDILIWHANLSHGGEPHLDKTKTRKSMVFHYFGADAICYHEITQRPALM